MYANQAATGTLKVLAAQIQILDDALVTERSNAGQADLTFMKAVLNNALYGLKQYAESSDTRPRLMRVLYAPLKPCRFK